MSNYIKHTTNPRTGEAEKAEWLDDYFGKHVYGIRFADGGIYCENQIMVAEEESERRRPKQPTLAEWRERWEAESDEGRRQTISWEEAERRYNKMYPSDEPYEPYR